MENKIMKTKEILKNVYLDAADKVINGLFKDEDLMTLEKINFKIDLKDFFQYNSFFSILKKHSNVKELFHYKQIYDTLSESSQYLDDDITLRTLLLCIKKENESLYQIVISEIKENAWKNFQNTIDYEKSK